ncbi:hypothetical protein BC829DRAFT_444930 [Chytridium lagenaria]|nr:hypothetical protein BC829DRAFT_444930 [Chytridium lagenaria]
MPLSTHHLISTAFMGVSLILSSTQGILAQESIDLCVKQWQTDCIPESPPQPICGNDYTKPAPPKPGFGGPVYLTTYNSTCDFGFAQCKASFVKKFGNSPCSGAILYQEGCDFMLEQVCKNRDGTSNIPALCANNGKTYDDNCVYMRESCETLKSTGKGLSKVTDGACSVTTLTVDPEEPKTSTSTKTSTKSTSITTIYTTTNIPATLTTTSSATEASSTAATTSSTSIASSTTSPGGIVISGAFTTAKTTIASVVSVLIATVAFINSSQLDVIF